MAVTAGAVVPLDTRRSRKHDLLAELREVDHWRRLVAARLDLAVAAVTAIDEPTHFGPDTAASLPVGLREILGLPVCDQALPEAALLLQLRSALRGLDDYARALRASADAATLELTALLDAGRPVRRAARFPRDGQTKHLHAVGEESGPMVDAAPKTTAHSTESTP